MLTVPIRLAPENQTDLIASGLRAANTHIFEQNKIWARYSDEKADIAESLLGIMRRFGKTLPHDKPLRALSIGSSSEPQFRLLEAGFRGGLYLFDNEPAALDVVNEKIARQQIRNVTTVQGDYTVRFSDPQTAANTLIDDLGGHRFELITLHHALYYADPAQWQALIEALVQSVLAPDGVIHIVLMSPEDQRLGTTTCLYNTFARKFFNHENKQDLLQLKQDLISGVVLKDDELVFEPRDVRFFADDFEKLMSVIWMIMLYPDTHDYSLAQRREITAYVRDHFWLNGRPLLQVQDSLCIYRGRCALH